jgi:hypothetical protein
MGEWRDSSYILNLGTRWRWVARFVLLLLHFLGKSSRHLLDRRLGGPQSQSERYGEDKNLLPLSGIEPGLPGRLARILAALLTEMFQAYRPSFFIINIFFFFLLEQISFWDSHLPNQDNFCFLVNLRTRHKSPSLNFCVSQMNLIHNLINFIQVWS